MEEHEFQAHLATFRQRARGLLGTLVEHQRQQHEQRLSQSGITDRGVDARSIIGSVTVRGGVTLAATTLPIAAGASAALPVIAHQESTIESVILALNVAPVGADIIVAITKNGTEITDPSNRPTIPASTFVGKVDGSDLQDQSVLAGDVFNMDIVQVGSTTPGSGLVASIKLRVQTQRGGAV